MNYFLHSGHPVFQQLEWDLRKVLSGQSGEFEVVLGVHEGVSPQGRNLPVIAIQTEHFFDENGRRMPRMRSRNPFYLAKQILNIRAAVLSSSVLIELSSANRPLYSLMGLSRKTLSEKCLFGPYIFPSEPPVPWASGDPSAAFYGTLTERRTQVLKSSFGASRAATDQLTVTYLGNVFKQGLELEISKHQLVLNIHAYDGVYTEWPRVLSSLLNGKPLMSEPLSRELNPSKHYFLINERDLSRGELRRRYNLAAIELTQKFPFSRAIEKALGVRSSKLL